MYESNHLRANKYNKYLQWRLNWRSLSTFRRDWRSWSAVRGARAMRTTSSMKWVFVSTSSGLLCTLCLSKLGDIPKDQLASLEQLATVIADMTDTYEKNNKNGTNLLPLKAEIEQQNKALKALRDALTLDVRTIHSKTGQQIDSADSHCLKQFRNEPL